MSNITLTIPNDDHIALRAFGKALEEMALAHGAEPSKTTIGEMNFKVNIDTKDATVANVPYTTHTHTGQSSQIDTTAQQVESLSQHVNELLEVAEQPFMGETVPTTDSTGTPWDERIHSASKALNSDGTWRLRRKPKDMDEAEWVYFVDEVKNELMGIDAEDLKEFEESKQATIEPPVTPPGDDFHSDAGVVTEQTVVGIPPIPVPPPVVVPPVAVADEGWTFPKLMVFLTNHNGKISIETVNQILSKQGMQSLKDLNGNENSIPAFVQAVQSYLENESASN